MGGRAATRTKPRRKYGQLTESHWSALKTIGTYGCSSLQRVVKIERKPDGKGPLNIEVECPCGDVHEVSDPQWRNPKPGEQGELTL